MSRIKKRTKGYPERDGIRKRLWEQRRINSSGGWATRCKEISKAYVVRIHRGPHDCRFSPETGLATLTYAICAYIVEKYALDMQESSQALLEGDAQGLGFRL